MNFSKSILGALLICLLTVNPAPAQTMRVFVGRMELVTAATQQEVKTALASQDEPTLNKYSRFLEPILNIIKIIKEKNPPKAKQLTELTGATCNAEVAQKH
ncbi:MAG TPA: hypothetical protein VI636_12890 [Candidatus Angelobacter sp.]